MTHECTLRCGDATHYDVCYSKKDVSDEEFKKILEQAYRYYGVEVIEVEKVVEFDVEQAQRRMESEPGINEDGGRYSGRLEGEIYAYGIRVRLAAERGLG